MKAPTASEMMRVWERCLIYGPHDRALVILEAGCPDTPKEALAALSIGERDYRLLLLRQLLFGDLIASASHCPQCNELMEWDTTTDQLSIHPIAKDSTKEMFTLKHKDYAVEFRLPNSIDLGATSQIISTDEARHEILRRCISYIEKNGHSLSLDRVPKTLIDKILADMAKADPQADLRIELICANCQNKWEASFDIVSFLWAEIQVWAKQTLRSVHILARTYGWREKDILEMSPLRRQMYLEMTGY